MHYHTLAIQGSQFGDEGKGKITDYLAERCDVVCRFQGGNNAGHSIEIDGVRHALRSLPSGIFNPKVINVIASGVVVNPFALLDEIEENRKGGLKDFNLYISNRAHVIMPYHLLLDEAYEEALGDNKIGTTKRGIGPCYSDKSRRIGIRMGDLLDPDYLYERIKNALNIINPELKTFGKKTFDAKELTDDLLKVSAVLKEHIVDTSVLLNDLIDSGKKVLFEGAQGALLDLDHGTYPYVTSSSPMAISIPYNAGIAPMKIKRVLAIMKAYMTRVGEGPMPTEQNNAWGDRIRERGNEYGTVTKRPRRVGYLDLVLLGDAIRTSGATDLSIMLFDVLMGVSDLKICTAYLLDGKEIHHVPATAKEYERCVPVYKEFDSIPVFDMKKIKALEDLPKEARDYLDFIQDYLKVDISILSLGPGRDETILINELI